MPLSALKFHFLQITFFPPLLREHINYPHTLRFSDPYCVKNALYTFFLKLLFFALYSFSLPPKHFLIIFSGKPTTKNSEKAPQRRKKIFFFFIIYFTFSLSPYENKQNHLLFSPFISPEIGKPQAKTSFSKNCFFLFFFYFFLHTLRFSDP